MKERIEKYLEKNEYEKKRDEWLSASKKPSYYIAIIGCVVAFFGLLKLQSMVHVSYIGGMLAQLQVMISAFLVAQFYRSGFVTAVAINLVGAVINAVHCILTSDMITLPGAFVPLFTITTCTIIYIQNKRLRSNIDYISNQRQELVTLSEEIASSYDEIQTVNEALMEKNKVIEENEEQLRYLAFYDTLTTLPNRRMVLRKADFLIDYCITNKSGFSLAVIDLDNFKKINDTIGHQNGDEVLKEISKRLKSNVNSDDIVARLSGDEFAVLIQRTLTDEEIADYINKLRAIIKMPISAGNIVNSIKTSAGISVFPRDGQDVDEILKCADLAEHKAKTNGKNTIVFYDTELKNDILRRMNYETRLLSALKNNEFFLMYQPQYFTDTKKLRGFETLVRWQEPELGLICPSQFIPLAEENGIITELGEWILRTACSKLKQIDSEYDSDFILSINISAVQLMQPDFIDGVKQVLKDTGVDGKRLEFEITESVFISAVDHAAEVLKQVKELGILIALDDFGTGYSSLNYLCRLPIDTLKIDKSFIDQLVGEQSDKHIVGSIISLAHDMKMSIVAEGVEAERQLYYLQNRQCDIIQGFLWGKPLNESRFKDVLDEEYCT